MSIEIRPERADDAQTIRQITEAAFKVSTHSSGTEGAIIDALREADALTISLVALIDNEMVGHVAFSPLTIEGEQSDWFGLGPVAVRPDLHRQGIGSALIRKGLEHLKQAGANGCVLVGDPTYYRRFGFDNDSALRYEDLPAEYFMRLAFNGSAPMGRVRFHEGFSAS
ncbi:GNAT family N-acetyltransferase [Mesorhizobium sp. Cs1299R1N3]|uniref:GNAT family N-acetyltransferase n=1 Tax=Mesorhizobium sp. Cs1299R1N3 TaxID=3015173 RepID=UPI00301E4E93